MPSVTLQADASPVDNPSSQEPSLEDRRVRQDVPPPPPLYPAPRLEAPVVVVRLPGKRPQARRWKCVEQDRLVRVCQPCWPHVDWQAIARELDREVQDCISQSTLLHLQDLACEVTPPSLASLRPEPSTGIREPEAIPSRPPRSDRALSPGGRRGDPHLDGDALVVEGADVGRGHGNVDTSDERSRRVRPNEVAKLAVEHKYDWVGVGEALQADPWECWKAYEAFNADQVPLDGGPGSPDDQDPSISALGDEVAAFLPFKPPPSPAQSRSLWPSPPQAHHLHHAFLRHSLDSNSEGGNDRANRPSPIFTPLEMSTVPSDQTSAPPSQARRSFLQAPLHAPTTGSSLLYPPAALHPPATETGGENANAGKLEGGGGREGGQENEPRRGPGWEPRYNASLASELQESTLLTSRMGGGMSTSMSLLGADSISLSMLQSAMGGMPSLYLGQSTAFGAGASTFLGTASFSGLNGSTIQGDPRESISLPGAPPFFTSPHLPPPLPRRGDETANAIPATIMEGSHITECDASALAESES